MTVDESIRILDPETTAEALAGYAGDEEETVALVEESCRVAVAALREKQERQWIPVTERLPDWRDGKVLVSTTYGFSICERTVNGRWKGTHANWITHWMPLPEPPILEE